MLVRKFVAAIALVLAMVGSAAAADRYIGSFWVDSSLDPFTDHPRSMIFASGEEKKLSFIVKCDDDGVNVLVSWGKYFRGNADDTVTVTFRFGTEEAVRAPWNISTTNKGAFVPTPYVKGFILKALDYRQLLVRVEDSDGERISDTISLTGMRDALNAMTCSVR